MSTATDLLQYYGEGLEGDLALLRRMVELESHSLDKQGVDAFASWLAEQFKRQGATVELLPGGERGSTLRASFPDREPAPPVLLLGHLDTVWPAGTTRDRPFRIADGSAWGPGVFDMKAGILLCLMLCRALAERRFTAGRKAVFLFTADEEIGTDAGLPHLRESAAGCAAVLCLEPSLPGGGAKTFRKGVGVFRVRVEGVSAHAGVDHEKGANAVLELSRQVIRLHEMTDYSRGITVNVGTIRGGLASNVVASRAEAEVDLRVSTRSDGNEMESRIRSLRPLDSRCTILVEGGMNRPPLERTTAVVELFRKARNAALEVGIDLQEGGTGGGSDGSFTAAMGIPTLDGLGVDGDGAHALHEHIRVADIPRRAAFLSELLRRV